MWRLHEGYHGRSDYGLSGVRVCSNFGGVEERLILAGSWRSGCWLRSPRGLQGAGMGSGGVHGSGTVAGREAGNGTFHPGAVGNIGPSQAVGGGIRGLCAGWVCGRDPCRR
jgi:hypothetical protein